MADAQKTFTISIDADTSKAEGKYQGLADKIEGTLKVDIDADITKGLKGLKQLEDVFDRLTTQTDNIKEMRFLNVSGLKSGLKSIRQEIEKLTKHFTGVKSASGIQSQITDATKSLDVYRDSLHKTIEEMNSQFKSTRSSDSFFGQRKIQKDLKDIQQGNFLLAFNKDYNEKNGVPRILREIAQASQVADGLSKTIQISEKESITLGETFDKIMESVERQRSRAIEAYTTDLMKANSKLSRSEAGNQAKLYYDDDKNLLGKLGINGINADIITALKNIRSLEGKLPDLQGQLQSALERENAGEIKLSISDKSLSELSSKLNDFVQEANKITERSTKGILSDEEIGKVIEKYGDLSQTVANIHDLMSKFDIPLKKTAEQGLKEATSEAEDLEQKTKDASAAIDELDQKKQGVQRDAGKIVTGDSWGTKEIQQLIDSLSQLYDAISKIGEAFGEIKPGEGITSLLEQIKEMSDVLGHYGGEPGQLGGHGTNAHARANKKSIMQLALEARDSGAKEFNVHWRDENTVSDREINEAINKEWRDQAKRYIGSYDSFFKQIGKINPYTDKSNIGFLTDLMIGSGNNDYGASYGYSSSNIADKFNINAIKQLKPEDQIQRIMDFYNEIRDVSDSFRERASERISELETSLQTADEWNRIPLETQLDGLKQSLSMWDNILSIFDDKQVKVGLDFKYLDKKVQQIGPNMRKGKEGDQTKTIKDVFAEKLQQSKLNIGTDQSGGKPAIDITEYISQINELTNSLTAFQQSLSKGLGITGKKDDMSYLEQLSIEMKKITGDESKPKDIYFNPIVDDIRSKVEAVLTQPFKIQIDTESSNDATKKKGNFAEANKKVADSTDPSIIKQAKNEIEGEGEAAAKAAELKRKFVEANKEVASSAKDTADSTVKATDGIEKEGEAADKNIKNGRSTKKESEVDNETGLAMKQMLDQIYAENAKVGQEKIDHTQWERVLSVAGEYRDTLGDIVDVSRSMRDVGGEIITAYDITTTKGKFRLGDSGAIKDTVKMGDELTQQKAKFAEAKSALTEYEKAVEEFSEIWGKMQQPGASEDIGLVDKYLASVDKMEQAQKRLVKVADVFSDENIIKDADKRLEYQNRFAEAMSKGIDTKEVEQTGKYVKAAYEALMKPINERKALQDEMNKLTADEMLEKPVSETAYNDLADQLKKVAEAADEAIEKIRELNQSGKISDLELNKAEEAYRDAQVGDVGPIEKAQQKLNEKQTRDAETRLKEYENAVNEVARISGQIMGSGDKQNFALNDQLDAAIQKANEAKNALQEVSDVLKGSEYQNRINAANSKFADPTKSVEYTEGEYKGLIDVIQKATDARTRYNKMLTVETKSGIIDEDIRGSIVEEMNAASEAAEKALEKIKELHAEQKISDSQYKEATDKYAESKQGSEKSRQDLRMAELTKEKKEVDKAREAIEKYYEAVKRASDTKNKFDTKQASAKDLGMAMDQMSKYSDAANDAYFYLENAFSNGSQFIDIDGLQQIRDLFSEIDQIVSVFQEDGVSGFENVSRSYETLIENARTYAKIMEKEKNGEELTFSDRVFKSKMGQYYEDAKNGKGIFEGQSNEAFKNQMDQAQTEAFISNVDELDTALQKLGESNLNALGEETIRQLNEDYEKLIQNVNKYRNTSKQASEEDRASYKDIKGRVKEAQKLYDEGYYTPADKRKVEILNRRMSEWNNNNSMATDSVEQIKELQQSLDGISVGQMKEVEIEFERIKAAAADAGTMGKSFGDALKKSFSGLARYLMTYTSFYRVIGTFKQAVNIVKELDTAFTEMRKVSDEPLSVLKEFSNKGSFDIANRVGTTAKQIQQSTADWLRLGESFEDAKKSAEQSTVLLNVSEFDNIDSATESLVAMSQAYKDLGKGEIIDKLNMIGNNYSISTSELAQSLQKSAGTLTVAGDSIDEAIALTVAGNTTLQDPLTVGQSLKTIALRLNGTSVEDMQEAGEEIDGLISTKSKLRKTIMDLTKVASNDYKGFDILDEHGNYKSTYEKLKGISAVFKEIGEEDKKWGTNRQSSLLETLAGKTRAAAASSILEHPEMLEDVYNDSLYNSAGSAQHELSAYMDSVDGKIVQLQNHLQELATVTISSDWLKDIIDLGSGAISTITKISDAFGGLSGIIGAIGGVLLQMGGFGILSQRANGSWGLGGLLTGMRQNAMLGSSNAIALGKSGFIGGLSGIFTNGRSAYANDTIKWIQENIGDRDNSFKETMSWNGYRGSLRDTMTQNNATDKNIQVITSLKGINLKEATSGELQDAIKQQNSFGGIIGNGIKNIGLNVLSGIATMGITALISAGIGAIAKVINNKMHEHENKIKAGEEAQTRAEQIRGNMRTAEKTTKAAQESYSELRKGVRMNGNTIENISLSTEQYENFLSINQQLADSFPQLISGITESGQALVDLGTNAEEARKQLQETLEFTKSEAAEDVKQELPDIIESVREKNKDIQREVDDLNIERTSYQNFMDYLDTVGEGYEQTGAYEIKIATPEEEQAAIGRGIETAGGQLLKVFEKAGLKDYGVSNGEAWFNIETDKQLENLNHYLNNAKDSTIRMLNGIDSSITGKQTAMKSNWLTMFVPNLLDVFKNDYDYIALADDLEDALGDSIENILVGIDYDTVYDRFRNKKAGAQETDFESYIFNDMFQPISDLVDRINSGEETQISKLDLSKFFDYELDDLTTKERDDKIQNIVETLFPNNEELQHTLLIALHYEFVDDEGNIQSAGEDALERFHQILGGEGSITDKGIIINKNGANYNKERKLSQEDIKLFNAAVDAGQIVGDDLSNLKYDGKLIGDFDGVLEVIEKLRKVQEETPSGTLQDILKSDNWESMSTYQTNLDSLSGAMDKIRQNGKLTADEMVDLQESFPDLTDFSMEGISKKAGEEFVKFGNEFRKATDFQNLTEDGKKQVSSYIDNVFDSYAGKLKVSEKEARKALWDSYKDAYHMDAQQHGDEVLSAIQQEFGEVDGSIVLELIADGTMAEDDIQAILEKYRDQKIIVDLAISKESIQDVLDINEGIRNLQKSKNEYYSSTGKFLTPEDYDEILEADQSDVKQYQQARKNAFIAMKQAEAEGDENAYKEAKKEYDKAWSDYYNSRRQWYEDQITADESVLNEPLADLKEKENTVTELKNEVEHMTKNGKPITQEIGTKLADAYKEQSTAQMEIAELYKGLSEAYREKGDDAKADEYWENYIKYSEDAVAAADAAQEAIDSISKLKTGGLTEILGDESFKNKASNYESSLNTLTDALDKYREAGKLTADEMKNLQQSFPEMTDFSSGAINEEAITQLNDYIGELEKQANVKNLSAEGKKQYSEYVKNMVMSYADSIDFSQLDPRQMLMDFYKRAGLSDNRAEYKTSGVMQRLEEEYGIGNISPEVIFTITSDTTNATADFDGVIAEYKDVELMWKVHADTTEMAETLDRIEKENSLDSAAREYKKNKTGYVEPEDYKITLANDDQTIIERQGALERAIADLNDVNVTDKEYGTKYNDMVEASTLLYQALSQKIQDQKESDEAILQAPQMALNAQKNEVTRLTQAIETARDAGEDTTGLRQQLVQAYDNQATIEAQIADLYGMLAENANEADKNDYIGYQNEFNASATESRKNAQNTRADLKYNKRESYKDAIMGDYRYQTYGTQYESNLNTLKSALEELDETGEVSTDSILDGLQEIDGFDFSGPITRGTLTDAIRDNIQAWEDMFTTIRDEKGLKGDKAANNLLKEWNEQWAEIPMNAKDAEKAVNDFFNAQEKHKAKYSKAYRDEEALGGYDEFTRGEYDQAIQQLTESGKEINWSIVWEIFNDPTAEIESVADFVSEYDNREIKLNISVNDKELQKIESKVEKLSNQRNASQSMISAAEASGQFGSRKEYAHVADYDKQLVDLAQDEVDLRSENLLQYQRVINQNGLNINDEGVQREITRQEGLIAEAQATLYDRIAQQEESYKNLLTYDERAHQFEIDKRQDLISSLNDLSQHYTEEGKVLDRTTADQIAAFERANKTEYEEIAAGYAQKAKKNPQYATEFMALSYAAQNQANAITPRTADQIISESQVASLQVSLTELQDKAVTIQDAITLQEGQGLKPTLDTYEKLIRNGKQQIQNLERQNQLIRNTQANLVRNTAEWRRQQSLINQNNSAIAAMRGNLNNWKNNLSDYAATVGNDLLSALQTAFNESISKSGLQPTTMRQLAAQFEGIEGFDYADIFYNTAQGVKLDAAATERLVDAQYGLITNDLTQRISEENHALANLRKEYRDTSDAAEQMSISQKMDLHQGNLDNLYNQLAQYQAFYGQAQELFSARGEWQRAQQTENAGAPYTELQGYLQTQEDAWKKGLVGTDEFKAYTAIFDEWGRNTLDAYTNNRDKIKRYLTDDYTGGKNLYDDLVSHGFATIEGEDYKLNKKMNVNEAAHALGISGEFLKYALARSEDYGFENNYVSSQVEGELKLQEAAHDTAEAIKRKNDLIAQGAPTEVIEEAQAEIDRLDNKTVDLIENTQEVARQEGRITKKEVNAAVDSIRELSNRAAQARKEGRLAEANEYAREAENVADAAGIKLNPDGTIDYAQLGKDYKGWTQPDQLKTVKDINNEQLDSVKLEGESIENNETLQSGLDKLKKGWKGNIDQVQKYVDALQNADVDDLKAIDLNDGKYADGLKAEEDALDGLARTFGLTADEAQLLVPILQELGLIGQEGETTYRRAGQGGTLGIDTSHAESFFDSGEYKSQNGEHTFSSSDLTFDATSMSIDQINEKLDQLTEMREIAVSEGNIPEVIDEIDTLTQAAKDEKYIKLGVESALEKAGMTADEFLGLDKLQQEEYLANVGINPGTEQFDRAMAEIESQSIEKKIDAVLSANAEMTIEQLLAMDDETLMATVGCEDSQVDATREKLQEMAYSDYDVKVAINGESLNGISTAILAALNGQTYEAYIEANTEPAQAEIAGLDGQSVTENVEGNIEPAAGSIDSLNGKTVTANVDASQEQQLTGTILLKATVEPPEEQTGTIKLTPTVEPTEEQTGTIKLTATVEPIEPQEGIAHFTPEVDQVEDQEATVHFNIDVPPIPEQTVNVKAQLQTGSQLSANVNYKKANQEKASNQTANVAYKKGSQEKASNQVATVTYKKGAQAKASDQKANVNYTLGDQAAPIDKTANVNYQTGTVDPIEDQTAIANYELGESPEEVPDASGTANFDLGSSPDDVPDAHGTANFGLGSSPTYVPPASGTANFSLGSHPTSVPNLTAKVKYSPDTSSLPTHFSPITRIVKYVHQDSGAGTKVYTGTMTSIGNGHAKGTVGDDNIVKKSGSAYNVINYKDAKAKGDVAIKRDEESLINEVGQESIIRDGRWLLIPGGPHIEHLKKGDIVFNHEQTEDLLEKGRTKNHARIVGGPGAFAQGTTNGMRAYIDGTRGNTKKNNTTIVNGNNNNINLGNGTMQIATKGGKNDTTSGGGHYTQSGQNVAPGNTSTNTGGNNNTSTGSNTNTGGNNQQQQPAAEPEKLQYSQDIFDYVELRLKYFADATKKIADKITDYVSDVTKGRLLRKEIEAVQNEISVNSAAAGSYSNFAEKIARSFAYTDKDGNKKLVDLTSSGSPINYNLLKQGYIGKDDLKIIETTQPDQAAYVEAARAYLDYIDKAREANNSVQDLTNTLADLYQQIIELPTDKLEKWLDKLEKKIDTVTGAQGAISSGMSGVRSAQRMLGFATDITAQDLNYMNKLSVATGTQLKRNTTYNTYKAQIDAQTKAGQDVLNSSAYKNATKAQKDAIKKAIQGEDVVKNVGGLGIQKGTSLYDLLLKYNTNANKRWDGDVRKAYMAAVEADDKADTEAKKAKAAYEESKKRASDVSQTIINDGSKRSFIYQNNYLDKELKLQKEELKKHRDAMEDVEKTIADFQVDQANTKSAMDKQKNVLLKDLNGKKGEAIIKDAVSKGKQINVEDVDDSLKNAVGEWNKLVITYGQLGDAITRAKDKEDEVREDLNQAAYETAEMEQKNAKQKFENIKAYYEAIADYHEARANVFAKQLSLLEEWEARGANARGRLTDGLMIDPATGIPTIKNDSGVEQIKKYYDQQINEMKENRSVLSEELGELEKEFSNQQKSGLLVKDSEEWMEAKNQIYAAKMAISDLEISIDKLYDKMLQDVYFKPIEKAIENLDKLRKSYESLEGLISQDMMYTEDGTFTDLGLAKYTMDVAEYKAAQDQLNELEKERLMVQRMYNPDPDAKQKETGIYNDVQYSTEEYTKKMEEIQEKERQTLSSMASTRKEIIKDVTDRYQTEITYINKLIDARKAEINKKKEMYEYDKKLKKQTKEVQLIEQQIRALNGLTDAESKAQKARLEAQRKELQEELDDTVRDHVTELRIEGLSELQEQLQKNYEKLVKDLAINVDDATKLVADSADNLSKTLELTNGALNQFIKSFNPDVWWASLLTDGGINYNRRSWNESDLDLMERPVQKSSQDAYDARDEYYAKHHYTNNLSAEENEYWKTMTSDSNKLVSDVGRIADALTDPYNTPRIGGTETKPYAKGTTHAKGGMSLVNDGPGNKPEMIVTKRGILIPLSPGDGVVPGDLTANLMQIAKSGALPLQMPEIKIPDINMGGQVLNSTADIHFDSLIRVDGNVDETVLPAIKDIATGLMQDSTFKRNIYTFTSKELAKDMKKAGH